MDKDIERQIEEAAEQFRGMLVEQYERNKRLAAARVAGAGGADCGAADKKTVIGLAPGDGIGPVIMDETKEVLGTLLADELASGRAELRDITGFTLEERLSKGETVPADVLS